jgi:hypothetical protein
MKVADHLLHALVDVGAVEGGDPGVEEGLHVGDGRVAAHLAVIAGELPAALEHARDAVAGAQFGGLDAHASSFQ